MSAEALQGAARLAGPLAAVDCGTNSTRLLVADGRGKTLARRMRITRLGEGVGQSGRIREEALARTVDVLVEYRREMDLHGVVAGRQVATSAVRDAENGRAFLLAATAATALETELLSGEEEGGLSFAGATADVPPIAGIDVVVDIGGGSTELAVGRAGLAGEAPEVASLALGCVRITERYLRHDPPLPDEVAGARRGIQDELERGVERLALLADLPEASRLFGLAGTVSTVASLEQGLKDYDRERIHHYRLTFESVQRWCEILSSATSQERLALPGMVHGREDVILGGVLVLAECMARFGFDSCLVSEADILDGLILSQLVARPG